MTGTLTSEIASNMTIADISLAVFNGLRFLAHVPQIAKAIRDQSGAEAISFGTWALFLASHASAMVYAIEGDWTMASLFLGNAFGCGTVLLIAAWKRSRHRSRRSSWQKTLPTAPSSDVIDGGCEMKV